MPRDYETHLVTCPTCTQQSELPDVATEGPALFGCWRCQGIFELHPDRSLHPVGTNLTPPAETMRSIVELISRSNKALAGRDGIVPLEEMDRITSQMAEELGLKVAPLTPHYVDFDIESGCLHCVVSNLIDQRSRALGTIDAMRTVKDLMMVVGNVVACAETAEQRKILTAFAIATLDKYTALSLKKLNNPTPTSH